MKVTNWRRKLAASLVAGGLMAPAAYATNLNENLLIDGGFEDVGAATCCYGANILNSWTAGTQPGFAYAYSLQYDNRDGGLPPASGDYYFTSNGDNDFTNPGDTDILEPGKVSQIHTVTPGTGATQIGQGEAAAVLSGYFSSYAGDGDYGHLHVEFFNSGGTSLGTGEIDGSDDTSTWLQYRGAVFVPVGTASIKTSVYGTSEAFGPDGYIDNVDVRLVPAIQELLFIEVDTTSGVVKIKNQSGDPFNLDYYEITAPAAGGPDGDYNDDGTVDAADYVTWRKNNGTNNVLPNDPIGGTIDSDQYNQWAANFGESGAGALDPIGWNSLEEQDLAGFPAGNGTGNGWEEAGGSSGTVLSESYLLGNSLVAHTAEINLGAAFNVGSAQNLEFRYSVVSGGMGPGELVQGFVRYITPEGGGAGAVPEPSSVLLVGMGLATLAFGGRAFGRNRPA
jgi:hypothetical protein